MGYCGPENAVSSEPRICFKELIIILRNERGEEAHEN